MKPLARIFLSWQRLYEKKCDSNRSQETHKNCAVSAWTNWSNWTHDCNYCGNGKRSRQRYYINPFAFRNGCKKKLTDHEECYGRKENCDDENVDEDYNRKKSPDPDCELEEWTQFSDCSTKCGRGQRSRTRSYKVLLNHKKCQKKNPVALEQLLICFDYSNCSVLLKKIQKPETNVRFNQD